MFTKIFVFVNIFPKNWNFPENIPIRPTCLVRLSLDVRSKMSYPDPSFLSRLSYPSCSIPAALPRQPCPGNLVHSSPDATVLSWQSCHLCPFQAHLSRLPFRTTYPDCPDQTVCPDCRVPALRSEWSCPRCPISTATVVPSWLSYPCVMFWPFCLYFLSWLYYPI
jgi:hypothetical protein